MRRYKEWNRRKKGVAGIIAATILFAMIFTTGAAYFMFVQYNYQLQHQASIERNQMEFDQSLEQFLVGGSVPGSKLLAQVNNTGPIAITIVQVFYFNADNGTFISSESVTSSNTINPGTAATVGSGISYSSGNRLIKVLTARGNLGSGIYPPPQLNVTYAGVAGGLGSIELDFNSYIYYNETLSGNIVNSLQNFPKGGNAYGVVAGPCQAFSVSIKNLDPNRRTLIIDSNSLMWQFSASQGVNYVWFIANVTMDGKVHSYTTSNQISVSYGQTRTLYFAVGKAGTVDKPSTPPSGVIAAVFLILHGKLGSDPYGQNIPFVSTYYS